MANEGILDKGMVTTTVDSVINWAKSSAASPKVSGKAPLRPTIAVLIPASVL